MNKTNIGLIEYCRKQLGKPYWYGTFGQKASRWLYDYNKSRLPSYYKASNFQQQIAEGQKVHDCIGLIKGYMWCSSPDDERPVYKSNGFPDISSDGQYSRSTKKGANISTLPEVPGILVFMTGHVGVYIGKGKVIEARGHDFGVVETNLKDRPWKCWAYIDEIEYITENPKPQEEKPGIITSVSCNYK